MKSAGQEVCERGIDFGPGYKVYFGQEGEKRVILLPGGTKKRQQSDIDKAKAYGSDDKRRKKEGG